MPQGIRDRAPLEDARVAALARDTIEVVAPEWKKIAPLDALDQGAKRVASHPPCSLQHGMKIRGEVEEILRAIGHEVVPVADAHLCCGSAGTYNIMQPEIASQLKRNKLAALEADLAVQAPVFTGRPIVSVFFGGGTPSLFPPDAIARVL